VQALLECCACELTTRVLAAEEQSALKKKSTDRLRLKLLQTGMADEEVLAMDWAALLNAVTVSMRASPTACGYLVSRVGT
jgi:hypothetical protein